MNHNRMLTRNIVAIAWVAASMLFDPQGMAQEFRPLPLQATLKDVQPMTGIVLWSTNERVDAAPIQLEYAYVSYNQVIRGQGDYDFTVIDSSLESIARRRHQAILRFYDTYVGKPSGIPKYIQALPDYQGTESLSEGKKTGFPDWSNKELQSCILDFFSAYAKRFDRDPRIAFLQVGFGLWSEYHIYDGPMVLGKTFPSMAYQTQFLLHMGEQIRETPWMISVDAADDERTPIVASSDLMRLPFGLFDDSINHKKHKSENEPNWDQLGRDRWKRAPTGGEFSFFQKADQSKALVPNGPHGIPFETQAAKFQISFVIGDDQLRFQKPERVKQAGMAMGYRFRVTQFESNGSRVRGAIKNVGIAPLYYDAFPAVGQSKAAANLKGLLPGDTLPFEIDSSETKPQFHIACHRLVPGQQIQWEVGE